MQKPPEHIDERTLGLWMAYQLMGSPNYNDDWDSADEFERIRKIAEKIQILRDQLVGPPLALEAHNSNRAQATGKGQNTAK